MFQNSLTATDAGYALHAAGPDNAVLSAADIPLLESSIARGTRACGAEKAATHLLQKKLAAARIVQGQSDPQLVRIGSKVTWMVSGGGAQHGILIAAHKATECDRTISIDTVLGATLIGLRPMVRSALPRPDGETDVLVVLRVTNAAHSAPTASDACGLPAGT